MAVAIIIVIISVAVLTQYYVQYSETKTVIDSRYADLTKPLQPYTFQIPLYLRFNNTNRIGTFNESGIAFRLTFTYPNGTLVTNEPVTIDSTAIMDYAYSTLDHISIFFQNSLAYPISYENNGIIPRQGTLNFQNPYHFEGTGNVISNISVGSYTQVIWPIEGDYTPIIGVFFTDGTNKTYIGNDVVIHVYPAQQLTQIDTERTSLEASQASLKLSEAVFILGSLSVLAVVIQILDRSETVCKYTREESNNQHEQSEVKQEIPDYCV